MCRVVLIGQTGADGSATVGVKMARVVRAVLLARAVKYRVVRCYTSMTVKNWRI